MTNTKVSSAFHPSGLGKSSTGLSGFWGFRWGAFTCVAWHVSLIPYGRWRSVVLRRVSHKELYTAATLTSLFVGGPRIVQLLDPQYFSHGPPGRTAVNATRVTRQKAFQQRRLRVLTISNFGGVFQPQILHFGTEMFWQKYFLTIFLK